MVNRAPDPALMPDLMQHVELWGYKVTHDSTEFSLLIERNLERDSAYEWMVTNLDTYNGPHDCESVGYKGPLPTYEEALNAAERAIHSWQKPNRRS